MLECMYVADLAAPYLSDLLALQGLGRINAEQMILNILIFDHKEFTTFRKTFIPSQ